jgi:hypothetical protein
VGDDASYHEQRRAKRTGIGTDSGKDESEVGRAIALLYSV